MHVRLHLHPLLFSLFNYHDDLSGSRVSGTANAASNSISSGCSDFKLPVRKGSENTKCVSLEEKMSEEVGGLM